MMVVVRDHHTHFHLMVMDYDHHICHWVWWSWLYTIIHRMVLRRSAVVTITPSLQGALWWSPVIVCHSRGMMVDGRDHHTSLTSMMISSLDHHTIFRAITETAGATTVSTARNPYKSAKPLV